MNFQPLLTRVNGREGIRNPYAVNLDAVTEIASDYGEKAIVLTYLHDVVEDTDVTLNDLEREFGKFLTRRVGLLTDELGKNRKERKRMKNWIGSTRHKPFPKAEFQV